MKGQHLVPLRIRDGVFGPDWAVSMVVSAYDHVLYGPETMLVRHLTLTTLRDARFRVLSEMTKTVRDRYKGVQ